MKIAIYRFNERAVLPVKSTALSTGYDLYACLEDVTEGHPLCIPPHQTKRIPLGFNMRFAPGWDIQIRSRSGMASKGIVVANSPGTIDADYCGVGPNYEVAVLLLNTTSEPVFIEQGQKIAQMIAAPINVAPSAVEIVEESLTVFQLFVNTGTRVGGFGSTGI